MKNAVLLLLVGGLAMAQVKTPPKHKIVIERFDFVVSPFAHGEQKGPGIRIELHGKSDFTTADVVVRADKTVHEYEKTTWIKTKNADSLVVTLNLDPELKEAFAKAKEAEITITPLFSVQPYVVKFTEEQLADFRVFFHEEMTVKR
ncbi:MAG TPA: hypothetical protein VHM88_03080 [Candidatus Acidoferrales bacterium]|nr:hypothetical protein [Candidatus Acidoferrales bacterium]